MGDNAEQSDSTLPSINTLSKRQGRTSRRDSLDSLFEDPDPQCEPASPTFDHASQEPSLDMASSLRSSPSLSGTSSRPRADDATLGCESRSGVSPRRDEPDHPRGTASASSTRPGTPKAGSPTPASPSRPHRRGTGIQPDASRVATTPRNASRSRSPRKRRSNPRRTSQRLLRNIGVSANSDPDASSDSDSDDASVSARHQPETYDDEEFHPPYLSECGHGGSRGGDETDEELGSPPPKRRKPWRSPASPSRRRRSGIPSLDPDTLLAQARTPQLALNIPSPPSSHDSSQDSHCRTTSANFEEWPLPNATLKRVTLGNGRTTFQLQFDWDLQADDRQARCPRSNRSRAPISKKGNRRRLDTAPRVAFTREEDKLLIELKEGRKGLTWLAIYRLFDDKFPGRRSQGSLQVHYCTKLKRRGAC